MLVSILIIIAIIVAFVCAFDLYLKEWRLRHLFPCIFLYEKTMQYWEEKNE